MLKMELGLRENRLKVLICCHQPYATGANLALLDWLRDTTESIDRFYILLPFPNKALKHAFESLGCKVWIGYFAVPVRHLHKRPLKKSILDWIQVIYSILFNPFSKKLLGVRIKANKINIIHSNSFATLFGAELAEQNKLPHIWHIREFMESDHKIEHFDELKVKELTQKASAIFISPAIEKAYIKRFNFKSTTTILDKVVRNEQYKKTRQFMEDEVCRLLMVGALSPEKGQVEAIKATSELHQRGFNVQLTLCGSGDLSYVSSYLGMNLVRYIGQQDSDKLLSIRQNSDIALVCSKNEAFGRVSVEAMYYGNVLVAADTGFTAKLVIDGMNGLQYHSGSYKDLADKIESLIEHPDVARRICQYASNSSAAFSRPIFPLIADYYNYAQGLEKM